MHTILLGSNVIITRYHVGVNWFYNIIVSIKYLYAFVVSNYSNHLLCHPVLPISGIFCLNAKKYWLYIEVSGFHLVVRQRKV